MEEIEVKDSGLLGYLRHVDPEVVTAIENEMIRQQGHLELIASENIVSRAVLEAQGSILTNKYAEGYPGARYYGGCEYVDEVEKLACSRAKKLFGAEHANVQPHAGAPANLAVYLAVLKPGDRLLGMGLAHGGHLTHGSSASISGRYFTACHYGVDRDSGLIDFDQVRSLANSTGPRLIVAGASSYPRRIDYKAFHRIAEECGALLMVDMAHVAGLVAAGLHPNPVSYADFTTTTTHKTLRGPRGGMVFCLKKYAQVIDKAIFPGLQGGPLMHVIAAKAVALLEARKPSFAAYQRQVLANASMLAETLLEHDFDLVTGGTDTHIVLVDLCSKGITGLEAEIALGRAGITTNKNSIPFDRRGPQVTSGLRLGTPAITSRGMGLEQVCEIGGLISEALSDHRNEARLAGIRRRVEQLCREFPIYCD